jgi:hypothetical protein
MHAPLIELPRSASRKTTDQQRRLRDRFTARFQNALQKSVEGILEMGTF